MAVHWAWAAAAQKKQTESVARKENKNGRDGLSLMGKLIMG
jgi:hypothetical protein